MKIQKTELAQKLNKIKGIVPKKSNIPALEGVLVADGYLIANNMELTVKAKLEGTEGESFIIPERAFDLIDNLPDGEMELSVTGKNILTIKADRIKNKYQTLAADDFPIMEAQKDGTEFTIPAEKLLESMRRVSYAVPAKGTNSIMTAMCLQAAKGKLNFVGLDGCMLAWDKMDYEGNFELLIPKSAVEKLKTLGLYGKVQIRHNGKGAVFVTEEFEIYTRLINGQYFPYQKMFKELPLHTTVSRTVLLDAMTRVKICTEEKCPVKFDLNGKFLSLSIKDRTTDYHETIELQEEMTETLAIGFDAKRVLETLKAFDCDNVGLFWDGAKQPMIVEAEDSDFRAMVLPVAIE